ncbi:HEPN domain protein [Vulcanisaeta distributa DSM 14429]|uniref:HEPN domain protein n=1 Tax=Vulcanisaeta distributa (strain DSM 14429 / JCM 11212 / NBRC 100878 / IC-017) TaxID=572478 RepID=E1QUI4_VULDI|nr:HEPN domain protein [Vulcanisaeta distributa DSM 14429]
MAVDRLSEAERWLRQSLRDLDAARGSLAGGYYEWACFQAQQAAEKAVKALLHGLGVGAWGHSIVELLDMLRDRYNIEGLMPLARELDRHYIPARYPNSFESGYPAMYYDNEVAERAIKAAEAIITWVRERLRELGLAT